MLGDTLDILSNLCICAGTLAMFCLGQGIFWIVVGSKQFESVVKDKIQIAKLFLEDDSNESLRVAFCKKMKAQVTSEDVEKIKMTQKENIEMMKNRFWGFFSSTASIFVITLGVVFYQFHSEYSKAITSSQTDIASRLSGKRKGFLLGLFLVLFSFSTEIFIFKFIIEPYIIIGDIEMFSKIV